MAEHLMCCAPFVCKGDEAAARKFQEVSKAYDTLRDPQKRQQYDALGADGYERMAESSGGGGGAGPFGGQVRAPQGSSEVSEAHGPGAGGR